ncbi:MAG: hypothetical protein A3I08_01355 [Candidatus Andersenbacteria bacterium RIFCSPLOWO2_02_FULL_46_11]|nr:MAG: hypothetical protein A3I08_01355 [Candidatus Andersenbacteria bacterium RIFCSPLOWO2_02_FULL_46_11]
MDKNDRQRVFTNSLLIVFLITTAVFLRSYHLTSLHTANGDEVAWLDVGMSIIRTGAPTTWTIGWDYHNWDAYWHVDNTGVMPVVTPWLDHPPTFGVLAGGWALLTGHHNLENPNWTLLRIPMIVISVLTLFFTYLAVTNVFGSKLALFTLFAYTFFPSSVIASRYILPENAVTLLLVISLAVQSFSGKKFKSKLGQIMVLAWQSIICYVAPAIKMSGLVVPVTLSFYHLRQNKFKRGLWFLIVGLLAVVSFITYGWIYSWPVFIGAQTQHALRPNTFAHFWTLFTKLDVGHFPLFDPSIIAGLIGYFLLMAVSNEKQKLFLFIPFLSITGLMLYVSPVEAYGWYKYLLYPLIAIGLGHIFKELCEGKYYYWVLFLPLIMMLMENAQLVQNDSIRRYIMMVFFGLFLVPFIWHKSVFNIKHVSVVLVGLYACFSVFWLIRIIP